MKGFSFSYEKTACVHFCRLRHPHDAPIIYLNGSPLEYKESIRFLGLWFDSRLSWKRHIDKICDNSNSALNKIKALCQYKWGAEQEPLKKVVRALVCSKLEYGLQVYSAASPSLLKKIDLTMNKALRLITGAYRTSPISSLQRESGLAPLLFRREEVMLRYYLRIRSKPNHFLWQILHHPERAFQYNNITSRNKTVAIRADDILHRRNIEVPEVYIRSFPKYPLWSVRNIKINTRIARCKKEDTSTKIYQALFQEELANYQGWASIFTDGSKTEEGVGCAIYGPNLSQSWGLPKCASIFTSELSAIHQALLAISRMSYEKAVICSDSLSSISALKNTFAEDPLLQLIFIEHHILVQRGHEVVILWVPSHVDIKGNEAADKEAKKAAAGLPSTAVPLPARIEDLLHALKETFVKAWRDNWQEQDTQLRWIRPSLEINVENHFLTRKDNIVLRRLAIGHTRITKSYLLLGQPQPRCPQCEAAPLTVRHILEDCPRLEQYRSKHKIEAPLEELFAINNKHSQNIVNFLKNINLYWHI